MSSETDSDLFPGILTAEVTWHAQTSHDVTGRSAADPPVWCPHDDAEANRFLHSRVATSCRRINELEHIHQGFWPATVHSGRRPAKAASAESPLLVAALRKIKDRTWPQARHRHSDALDPSGQMIPQGRRYANPCNLDLSPHHKQTVSGGIEHAAAGAAFAIETGDMLMTSS
jgi:hypothetical protein